MKGGPRRQGGGTRNNGWNCGVILIYAPAAAGLLGAAWEVLGRAAA